METIDKEFTYEKYGIKFRIVGENISVYYTQNDKSIEIISKDPTCLKTKNDIFEFLREQLEEHYKNKEINDIISEMLSVYKIEKKEYKEKQKEAEKLAKKEAKENKLSIKAKLIQFADSMELFKDQNGAPCVRYVEDKAKIYSVNSKDFSEYLGNLYYKKYNDVPTDQEIKSAISVYSAKAKEGETHELAMRSCWYDNAIWHDLGNWEAVKITKDGWEIVQDPPKIFRHYNNYDTTVKDISKINKNGDIKKLSEFITLKEDKQFLLYICKLCSAFIPDIQHPAISLSGKPGSKKSTTGRIFVEFVDNRKGKGNTKNLIDFPDDPKELAKILSNHWAVCFDNISKMSGKQSDVLSKYVTGANIEERELYTNNETYSTSYQGSVALTAIDELFNKSDILERLIGFSQPPQSNLTRIDDDIFWNNFYEAKGEILGGIFNVISKAMNIKNNVRLEETPRMASFVKWSIAFALEMGYTKEDFLEAYSLSTLKLNEKLINTNLVCSMIVKFIENKPSWEGNMSQLLLQLKAIATIMGIDEYSHGFPKDHVWLGRIVSTFENNLNLYGISIIETNKAKRIYKIINNRGIEKSLFYDEFNLDFINKQKERTPWSRWTCFSKDGIPNGGNCSDCSSHKEMLEYLKANGYDKEGNKIIIQPCSRCKKETLNKPHSIIETEIVCSECDPIVFEQQEQEEIEEYISTYIERQLSEHQSQLDAEDERIEKELENLIPIPEELC